MISTTLVICIALAGAAIAIARMIRKSRSRLPPNASAENANWRDAAFASMLLSVAAALGLTRAAAEQSNSGHPDGGYSWHGGHLDHSPHGHADGGALSDGGGFSGGDAGGGGI
jgi:uncharacterized membrane protein